MTVGATKTQFNVHKRQLCDASSFFRAAFDGKFRERAGSMELLDEKEKVFEIFVQWVYQRKLDVSWPKEIEECMVMHQQYIQLYILADKYNIDSLMNQTMSALFNIVKHKGRRYLRCPPLSVVDLVYANSTQNSKLRSLITACYTFFYEYDRFANRPFADGLAKIPEFASDLAIALALRVGNIIKDPFWDDGECFMISSGTNTPTSSETICITATTSQTKSSTQSST